MGSSYSIIQYVPNPITDERINIGVMAFDDEAVKVKFLTRWDRVSCFASMADLPSLKEFASEMEKVTRQGLLFPGDVLNETPNHERLINVVQGWANSIQFTEPRRSLETVDDLLADIQATYLIEPTPKPRRLRDRHAAAQILKTQIRQSLTAWSDSEQARELLKTDYLLAGHHRDHHFDVTVANGRPFFAAHGVSFEIQTPPQTIDSLAFMIIDVKESKPNFPLAVVALPPRKESRDQQRLQETYEKTIATYKQLGAEVLCEQQIQPWAEQRLEEITH